MSSLDYIKWTQRQKQQRWGELRKILEAPWSGDRGWEGRTIGLHLPLELRNFAISVQEKLGLRSMKEVLFKALIIGLRELDTLPRITPAPPRFPPLREAPRQGRSIWQKILGKDKEDTWRVNLFGGWDGEYEENPSIHFYKNDDDAGYIAVFRDATVKVHRAPSDVPPDLVEKALDELAKKSHAVRKALPALRRALKLKGGGGTAYR